MKTFLLFLLAIVALFIFLANLGPLILLGVGVFLLYVIFKKFTKAESTGAQVLWVILGLIVLSMTVSNIFALVGLLTLYILYLMFKKNKDGVDDTSEPAVKQSSDPFTNFEREWAQMK